MDIYIPNIKLPKDEPGAFKVIVIYVDTDRKLRAGCEGTHEVTVVPPHGRLIDADAVTLEDGPYEYDDWCEWVLRQYQDAPTAIPASGEGE